MRREWSCVEVNISTHFCLLAICALTWASTFVGSWTASIPSTLIRLEMRTSEIKENISYILESINYQTFFYNSNLCVGTFWFWWRHQPQTNLFLNFFLSLPSCLSSQFLLFFLCEVNSQRYRLICINWGTTFFKDIYTFIYSNNWNKYFVWRSCICFQSG